MSVIHFKNMGPKRCFLFLCLLFVAMLCACGVKSWPRPEENKAEQKDFSFAKLTGIRQKDCLLIEAELRGSGESIEELTVEYAYDLCPTCPFAAQHRTVYKRDNTQFSLKNGLLQLTHCDMKPEKTWHWRLKGKNRAGTVSSPVVITQ